MSEIKKYSRKIRKIIKKNWEDIKHLFLIDKFEDKKERYLNALTSGNSHVESLIHAYNDEKDEVRNKEIIFSYENYLYNVDNMEFLGEIERKHYDIKYLDNYFFHGETDIIFVIVYREGKYEDWWEVTKRNNWINKFIDNGKKDLAIQLFNRFVKKKEIKQLLPPENNETSN